ncbi:hypothetical protein GR183_14120 [Stappia sp. GBMRC 2046]|uniref:Uncharacterized protein n=1 Tax=Stappia sediminis TaxID=2692190 RepID=A0A7X3S8N5_9HYPH|nr:hypothetical protein [Stappia sediminis]MXN66046.1 hypothetical protein [Stappia sediminis]
MNFVECNQEQEAALREVVHVLSRRILDIFEASLLMKQLALEDGTTKLTGRQIEAFVEAIREEAQIQCLDIHELDPASAGGAYNRLQETIEREARGYLGLPGLDLSFLAGDIRECMDIVIQRHVWRRIRIETETHRRIGDQIEALMALASDAADTQIPRLFTIKPIPVTARITSFGSRFSGKPPHSPHPAGA